MTDLIIVGTGGQGRELHEIVEALGLDLDLVGFLDDAEHHDAPVHGLPVLGSVDWLRDHLDTAVVVGVGEPSTRKRVIQRILSFGPRTFPTLVHPTATLGSRVRLGEGTFVCPGAVLTTDIRVGSHVLLNFGCTVGHDVSIGDHVTVGPGAHLSGGVSVGEGTDVGTGSSIVQRISIGEWSVLGAGTVVIEDVPANSTAVGVPARVIKKRARGWHL